jgi:hypothetical protein
VVDQEASHHTRGHRKEMRAVSKAGLAYVDQLQIGVVNQGRRIQRLVWTLASQTLMREASKLLVYQWDEAIQRLSISLTPLAEKACDIGWRRGHECDQPRKG